MYVNNEIGSIQPIEDIINIKNSVNKKIVIHVDAIQAYGKIEILPQKLGIDLMSISSHKIHGPKGVGALYINENIKVNQLLLGGGQEAGIRSGTENVSGISGFGLAADITFNKIKETNLKMTQLKTNFIKLLNENIYDFEIISPINSSSTNGSSANNSLIDSCLTNSSPYILNVSFKNVPSEVLLHHLEQQNIYVSTGSACSSKKTTQSHVLKALGIKPSLINGAIRFSFSTFNEHE